MDKQQLSSYKQILRLDKTDSYDPERKALFYIIASDEKLLSRFNKIYDIKSKTLNLRYIEDLEEMGKLSDSSYKLLRLGVNLYNGYIVKGENNSIMNTIYSLDSKQRLVMLNAIEIRLNLKEVEEC